MGPVYELFVGLESAKFGHLSKVVRCLCLLNKDGGHFSISFLQLSEVEERLTVLETLVGKPDQKGVKFLQETVTRVSFNRCNAFFLFPVRYYTVGCGW